MLLDIAILTGEVMLSSLEGRMADFNVGADLVLNAEGGYSNNPADPGGETYCGIARNYWPNWGGWSYVDEQKKKGEIEWNTKFPALNQQVREFYKTNFWEPSGLSAIKYQEVANSIFDLAVNLGNQRAVSKVQMMLNQRWNQALKVDGKMGPNTINVLNALDSAQVNNSIYKLRVNHYMKNAKPEFLKGLIARSLDFLVG